MRDIIIRKVMNGYVVTVGCQKLVFESQMGMMLELSRYLNSPEKVEREYTEKYGLTNPVGVPVEAQCAVAPGTVGGAYSDQCDSPRGR